MNFMIKEEDQEEGRRSKIINLKIVKIKLLFLFSNKPLSLI